MCKTEDRCDADGTDVASNSDRAAGSRAGSGGSPSMLTPLVHVAEGEEDGLRRTSELWQIHGKHFDLTGFLRQHPVSFAEERLACTNVQQHVCVEGWICCRAERLILVSLMLRRWRLTC